MSTWVWILIAVAVIVVLALLLVGGRKARERRVERNQVEERERMESRRAEERERVESRRAEERARADELRGEAQQRLSEAGQQEAVAQQAAERARRERAAAEAAIRRAEDVDPDAPNAPGEYVESEAGGRMTGGSDADAVARTDADVRENDVAATTRPYADDEADERR